MALNSETFALLVAAEFTATGVVRRHQVSPSG
jgi:hypothetical protein